MTCCVVVPGAEANSSLFTLHSSLNTLAKVIKGAWRMPWLTEAMKDVISCDKRGVGANIPGSRDFRMGQPSSLKDYYLCLSREANGGN